MNLVFIAIIILSIFFLIYYFGSKTKHRMRLYNILLNVYNKAWSFLNQTIRLPVYNQSDKSDIQYELSVFITVLANIAYKDNSIEKPIEEDIQILADTNEAWINTINKNSGVVINQIKKDINTGLNDYYSSFVKCLAYINLEKDLSRDHVTDYYTIWDNLKRPNPNLSYEENNRNSTFVSNAIQSRYSLFNVFIKRCLKSNPNNSLNSLISNQGKLTDKGEVIALQFFDLFYPIYLDIYASRNIKL